MDDIYYYYYYYCNDQHIKIIIQFNAKRLNGGLFVDYYFI